MVLGDGKKTFIKMPVKMRVSETPVLFVIDEEDNPMMVTYRVKGDMFIVDRLFEKAEMHVGRKQIVTIEFDDGRNFFERLFGL